MKIIDAIKNYVKKKIINKKSKELWEFTAINSCLMLITLGYLKIMGHGNVSGFVVGMMLISQGLAGIILDNPPNKQTDPNLKNKEN